jgi:hypothetical protein
MPKVPGAYGRKNWIPEFGGPGKVYWVRIQIGAENTPALADVGILPAADSDSVAGPGGVLETAIDDEFRGVGAADERETAGEHRQPHFPGRAMMVHKGEIDFRGLVGPIILIGGADAMRLGGPF